MFILSLRELYYFGPSECGVSIKEQQKKSEEAEII